MRSQNLHEKGKKRRRLDSKHALRSLEHWKMQLAVLKELTKRPAVRCCLLRIRPHEKIIVLCRGQSLLQLRNERLCAFTRRCGDPILAL
jgi:hypothetical protein